MFFSPQMLNSFFEIHMKTSESLNFNKGSLSFMKSLLSLENSGNKNIKTPTKNTYFTTTFI